MRTLNLSFYRFTPLDSPEQWASVLQEDFRGLNVKGTLILAPEGLNGFLAGPERETREAIRRLEGHPPFTALVLKESISDSVPFEKLCFKVKKEIVTFRQEVDPSGAPRLSPGELDRWYREENFLILDTRNEYEVKIGAFAGAHSFPIDHFVDFAHATASLPEEWKGKKIVTYCTGGIRCEKAAPYMRKLGFDAYQLDGGILNYFEKTSGTNWQGECFVFDERVAVDTQLKPTGARLCGNCQGPVPASAASCPHCGR